MILLADGRLLVGQEPTPDAWRLVRDHLNDLREAWERSAGVAGRRLKSRGGGGGGGRGRPGAPAAGRGARPPRAPPPPHDLCDALLTRLDGDTEDDIALLAVRGYPEDRPRPAEAGPNRRRSRAASRASARQNSGVEPTV